jgi:uncharacterized membrane protein
MNTRIEKSLYITALGIILSSLLSFFIKLIFGSQIALSLWIGNIIGVFICAWILDPLFNW